MAGAAHAGSPQAVGAAPAAAVAQVSPAARTSRLTPAAEQQLIAFFSLQDTLTRADISMLASRVRNQGQSG